MPQQSENLQLFGLNCLTGIPFNKPVSFNEIPTVNGIALALDGQAGGGDVVYTTGDQTISGIKTFSSAIIGNINGNSESVTNGVYTTGDQPIAGVKTFSNNIVGNGTANRLPNQTVNTSDSILTRSIADNRLGHTFSKLIGQTGKVQEFFDDFTRPFNGLLTNNTVNAGGGTASTAGFGSAIQGDIWFQNNTLQGVDRWSWKGLLGLQTNGTLNSIMAVAPFCCFSLYNSGSSAFDNFTEFSVRFAVCRNESNQFIRFGCALPAGGQAGANWSMSRPALCFDPVSFGNSGLYFVQTPTFVSSPFSKTYPNPVNINMTLNAGTFYNLTIKKSFNANGTLASSLFWLYNEKNNTTQQYTLSGTSGNDLFGGSPGVLLGSTDPGAGILPRKTMVIDWWYAKAEQIKTDTLPTYPWNDNRFTAP